VGKGEWRNNYIFPAIENPSNLNRIQNMLRAEAESYTELGDMETAKKLSRNR